MRKKAKFYLFFLTLLLFTGSSYGQYSLQTSLMIPSGDISYLLKPGVGFDISAKYGDIDARFKGGAFIGYYQFSATQDTFSTYAVGGSTTTALIPGWWVLHSYNMFSAGVTGDFKVLKTNLSPIIGLDACLNAIYLSMDENIEGIILTNTSGEDFYYNWEIIPRIGIQYQYEDNWIFSAGCGPVICFGGTEGPQNYWKTYVSVTYYIK